MLKMLFVVGMCTILLLSGVAGTSAKQTTLVVWNTFAARQDAVGEYFRNMNEEFQRLHPDITLDVVTSGSNMTPDALKLAIAANNPPDIFLQNRFQLQELAHTGLYQPITQLAAKAGFQRDQFLAGPWDESMYKGELYGIPQHTDARGIYYNIDLFAQAGLSATNSLKSWSELLAASKKLTRHNDAGEITQLGIQMPPNGNSSYIFGYANGARFSNASGTEAYLTEPALADAFRYALDLQLVGGYLPKTKAFVDSIGAGVTGGAFATNKLAMIIGTNSGVNQYAPIANLNWDVAPVPAPEGKQWVTWGCGYAFAIPTGAHHTAEAMEYIKFMMTREAQAEYGRVAHIAVLKSAIPLLANSNPDPRQIKFYNMTDHLRFLPGGVMEAQLYNIISKATGDIFNGTVPVSTALEQAQEAYVNARIALLGQ